MMAPSRGTSAPPSSPWTAFLLLWWAGFKDSCHFGRVYNLCKRSPTVRIKTGQCFLNGLLVLGSVLVLHKIMVPVLTWLLHFQSREGLEPVKQVPRLQTFLITIYYVFWLYPVYVVSFVVNCIHSNEIAEHVFNVLSKDEQAQPPKPESPSGSKASSSTVAAIESFTLGIGEQLYSVIVIGAFFAEAFAASFVPYVGPLLYFLLLSWLYAYYCFEYKWGLARWSLEKRLVFFESNWAFFFGFGSPCVLATFFFSPLVSTGVTAILYPLFVLIATVSDPEKLIGNVQRDSPVALPRLPIFYLPNNCTLPLLRMFSNKFPSMRRQS